MIKPSANAQQAAQLMERALVLLDREPGEQGVACLLQCALDALLRVPVMKAGDELDPVLLARFGYDTVPDEAVTVLAPR